MRPRTPKVSVFTTMPRGVYSGGRYLSMILAYSMARAGAEVNYVTNNAPLFERDFKLFEDRWPVRKVITSNYELPSDLTSDWVIVIPTGGFDTTFYQAALRHAQAHGARVALLSFETPNWYSSLSPFPRSPMPTESWRQVVGGGGLVITIAEAGLDFAREYFGAERDDLGFGYWHPPINDLAADQARAALKSDATARRRVAMFVRTEDRHKGAQQLLTLPPNLFDGQILSLVFGRGLDNHYLESVRKHFAPARDFAIEALTQITDEEKFRLLGQSRLLLFPSWFEGFGYPPVEAAEMGVPTVAYDLPALREVAGDAITVVPIGDQAAFSEAVRHSLSELPSPDEIRSKMRVDPGTLAAGEQMLTLLEKFGNLPLPKTAAAVASVPRNPLRGTAPVQVRLSGLKTSQRLATIRSRVSARRIEISGTVSGAAQGDSLRFIMAGARIADALLGSPQADETFPFTAVGLIDEWVGDNSERVAARVTAAAHLHCTLTQQNGETVDFGLALVQPDWATLLLWPEGPSRTPVPKTELPGVLVAFRPDELARDPACATLVSAICDTLDRLGRRTRLLIPLDSQPPAAVAEADVELLPRLHEVELLDAGQMAERIASAISAGVPVLVGPGCHDALSENAVRIQLSPEAKSGTERDVLLSVGSTRLKRKAVRPHPSRCRRSLADGDRCVTVVLAPGNVLQELPTPTLQVLRQIEARYDRLDVLVAERLWGEGADARFGSHGLVEALTEVRLASVIRASGAVLGMVPGNGKPDGLTVELLEMSGSPILAIPENGAPPVKVALDALDRGLSECPVAELISEIFAAAPRLMVSGPRFASAVSAEELLPIIPVLTPGNALSFSSTLGEAPDPALIQGWSKRDAFGAIMSQDTAVVAFNLLDKPLRGSEIELLFRISGETKPGPRLRIMLNGCDLSLNAPVPLGTSTLRFGIPYEDVVGPQILVLQQPSDTENGRYNIKLQALTIHQPPSKMPVSASVELHDGRAPLLIPSRPGTQNLAGTVQFGFDQPPGQLVPASGWSQPEKNRLWTDGRFAALAFRAVPSAQAGLVQISLEGETYNRRDIESQRIGIKIGGRPIVRDGLKSGELGQLRFALSAEALAADPPDYLLFELPDAISPRELGTGSELQELAFALTEATIQPLSRLLAEAHLRFEENSAATVPIEGGLGHASVVVRLRGTGITPEGQFAVHGRTAVYDPFATGPDSWEVCLPVSRQTEESISLGWVPAKDGQAWNMPDDLLAQVWGSDSAEVTPQGSTCISLAKLASKPVSYGLNRSQVVQLHPKLKLPTRYDVNATGEPARILGRGWAAPEETGTWSDDTTAEIYLPPFDAPAILAIAAEAFLPEGYQKQVVRICDTSGCIATLNMSRGTEREVLLPLPTGLVGNLILEFPDACVPADLGLSTDSRRLGIWLQKLEILPADITDSPPRALLDAGMAGDVMSLGMSDVIPERHERILWLTGSGAPPDWIGLRQRAISFHPRLRPDGSGWIAGVPVHVDAAQDGKVILVCVRDGVSAEMSFSFSTQGV